jgi:uncharacterized protein YbaR (Trm112 family)
MLDQELLDILVCPETKQAVALASSGELDEINKKIQAGILKTKAGETVEEVLQAGLLREDKAVVYPVRDDIPVMLIDEAIVLDAAMTSEKA